MLNTDQMVNQYLSAKLDKVFTGLRLSKQMLDELAVKANLEAHDEYYPLANLLEEISVEATNVGEQLHCILDTTEKTES